MAKVAAVFSSNTDWKEKVLHVAPGFSQRQRKIAPTTGRNGGTSN
jgi:hypothetical protein